MTKKRSRPRARAEPILQKRETTPMSMFLTSGTDDWYSNEYIPLSRDPSVVTAVHKIAELVSTMTIHLMKNTPNGDIRIKNELSRKIDINPYKLMTRKSWVHWIVETAFFKGNAFVLPIMTSDGLIDGFMPMAPNNVSVIESDFDYKILYNGKMYNSDEVLRFMINPRTDKPFLGESYQLPLKDVLSTLSGAAKTKKEFMSGKYNPSLIVKIDSSAGDAANKEGRDKIQEQYLDTSRSGQPWIIPADLMDVQQVKPLTLNDIALHKSVEIDKQTVAGMIGVPAFYLGVGTFNKDEHNNFIGTRILAIAKEFEQTLTQGILYSPDLYFKFNIRSLYAYSIDELSTVFGDGYIKGYITGNEARDALGLSPMDGLDELVILENFIPISSIGDQKKLKGDKKV